LENICHGDPVIVVENFLRVRISLDVLKLRIGVLLSVFVPNHRERMHHYDTVFLTSGRYGRFSFSETYAFVFLTDRPQWS
jgi:hypothetical protein